jgi:hypothetical protein
MKKKSTSQPVRHILGEGGSAPARRSPWLAVVSRRRRLGEGGFFKLRVLLASVFCVAGAFIALGGAGLYLGSSKAQAQPGAGSAAASEESPSIRISVMSYNIENGGAQVDFNKTVEAIKKSGADVVGIQEAWGNTARLAKAAGWKYYDQRQHIISRLPLLEAPDSHGLYTFIEVLPGKMVAMANMHLPDEPYGPDMVRSGSTAAEVEQNERKVRLPTAVPFVEKLSVPYKGRRPRVSHGRFQFSLPP